MFVVDTNILVYAADENSSAHSACLRRLEDWRRASGASYSTWGILYEFLRVVSHPRVMKSPWPIGDAWAFVESLLAAPGFCLLGETERHADVFREVLSEVPFLSGNLVHDAHTAILIKENGIRTIWTRDADFHRSPFLQVMDPLASDGLVSERRSSWAATPKKPRKFRRRSKFSRYREAHDVPHAQLPDSPGWSIGQVVT